jgi:hypothetical protein
MTKTNTITMAAVGLSLALAGFAAGRRHGSPAATATGAEPRTDAAAPALAAGNLRAAPLPPGAQGPLAQVAASTTTAAAAPGPDDRRVVGPGAVRDHIERVFSDEKPDPAWARSTEHSVESRLRRSLPAGATLHSVECHASLCRIETAHENLDEYQAFIEQTFMKVETQLWNGASYSTPTEDGAAERGFPVAIVSYLAREGRALPQL